MAEETEKSFPFDSEEVDGEYDRAYLADDFARYFRAFITSGVFMKKSTNLQVLANDDMSVTLRPGDLIIDGYRYENENVIIIQLDPADGVLNRIDRISGTWSKEDRDIHYTLQKGKPSYKPVPPECRRNADTKDYVFADVYIKAGAISVTQADITDQRLNSEVCGIANPFNEIDTTSIFIQFTKWLEITREKGEADVASLVADMEGYLEMLEISGDNQLKEILEMMRNFESASEDEFRNWLQNIKDVLASVENGKILEEVSRLLKDLYRIATDDDIDKIIEERYVDEDNEGSIFETGTNQDIDDIINGTYNDYEEADKLDDAEQQISAIIDNLKFDLQGQEVTT